MSQARCSRCVPITLLSIRYNVCTCSSMYCCLSGTTCSIEAVIVWSFPGGHRFFLFLLYQLLSEPTDRRIDKIPYFHVDTHINTSTFLSIPSIVFAQLFSLPLIIVVTQIRGHIAGSCSPYPLLFVPCIFIAIRFQLFLPSSTRVELCFPTVGALNSCSYFIFASKFKISPRRDSNSRTNTSSIRGLPLVHRGDYVYIHMGVN